MQAAEPRLHQLGLTAQHGSMVRPDTPIFDVVLANSEHGRINVRLDLRAIDLEEAIEVQRGIVNTITDPRKSLGDVLDNSPTKPNTSDVQRQIIARTKCHEIAQFK